MFRLANEPLFIQFSKQIKQKILRHEYQYGDKLPTEEALASMYGINRKTISKAKKLLIQEGVLLSVRGKGTYINRPPLRYNMQDMENSFSYLSIYGGHSPSSKVLFAGKIRTGNLKHIFQRDEEEALYRLLRIRYMDGIPLAVENTFLPYSLIPDIEKYDFTVHSLYRAMAEHDIVFHRCVTRINLIQANRDIAHALKMTPGAGVFKVEFMNYGQEGQLMEYTQFYSTDDKVDIFVKDRHSAFTVDQL